jgi:hypothetical protein
VRAAYARLTFHSLCLRALNQGSVPELL